MELSFPLRQVRNEIIINKNERMINGIISYLAIYWQPLSGLTIGAVVLLFVTYINWYGTKKVDTTRWITKHVFRNEFRSGVHADNLFMVLTSILLAVGWIMVGVAILYLSY